MLIFWIAILTSAIFCVVVSLLIGNINWYDIVLFLVFFYFSAYIIVELLKLLFGIRSIDDFKGLAQYVFGSVDDPFWERGVFYRESLINVKGRGAFRAWGGFFLSFIFVGFSIFELLS